MLTEKCTLCSQCWRNVCYSIILMLSEGGARHGTHLNCGVTASHPAPPSLMMTAWSRCDNHSSSGDAQPTGPGEGS